MQVSGHIYAPTVLSPPPCKESAVAIGQEAGWAQESFWRHRGEEKSSTPPMNRT